MAGGGKDFIKEKIIGRELNLKVAVKRIVVAILCGAGFGVAAGMGFFLIEGIGESLISTETARSYDEEEPLSYEEDDGDYSEETDGIEQEAALSEISESVEEGSPATLTSEEMLMEIDEAVSEQLKAIEYTDRDLKAMAGLIEELCEKVSSYVVDVHAVSTNTTLFDDTVESAATFSGVVIDDSDTEILILTTASAAKSGDHMRVTFDDGTETDAVLKQISETDALSVIAVSKEGLGTEFLSKLSAVPIGSTASLRAGSFIVAVGAPLGISDTFDVGVIGGAASQEDTVDGKQEVFYSALGSDPEGGTFVLDIDGELIGIVGDASSDTESGVSCIVSISYLNNIINSLKKGDTAPYIGLIGSSVNFDMSYEGVPRGYYVTEVLTSSPAYEAGIKSGDIVTGVGDTTISDVTAYQNAVRALRSRQAVTVTVMRSSSNNEYSELSFDITVGSR